MYAAMLTITLTGPIMLVCAWFPHSWPAVGYLPMAMLLALLIYAPYYIGWLTLMMVTINRVSVHIERQPLWIIPYVLAIHAATIALFAMLTRDASLFAVLLSPEGRIAPHAYGFLAAATASAPLYRWLRRRSQRLVG